MNWIADHTTSFGFSYSAGSYLNSLSKLDANNALLRDTRFGAALNENQLEASSYSKQFMDYTGIGKGIDIKSIQNIWLPHSKYPIIQPTQN